MAAHRKLHQRREDIEARANLANVAGPEILDSVDQIEKLDKVARRTFGLKDDNPYIGFSLNNLNLICSVEVRDEPDGR
jgi:hypothetical protein